MTDISRKVLWVWCAALMTAGSSFGASTATPIQHLVVIFQENVSFDHYFGTYPNASNPSGSPQFTALPNTPGVNGLSGLIMSNNPNAVNPANGTGASGPFRLDRSQNLTADQGHAYTPEQQAANSGLMDMFPKATGTAGTASSGPTGGPAVVNTKGLVMGYYDGNTVTAFWNYAQMFAMSDNSFGTTYGPSTPGALNLIAGTTNGVVATLNGTGGTIPDGSGGITMINDTDPIGDVCSGPTTVQVTMSGKTIGDLLNNAGVTWGFFTQGFDLTQTNPNGTTGCARSTTSPLTNVTKSDYIPHHEPFQYYPSTANPTHARPTSIANIGSQDQANHQYDMTDFYNALGQGNMPAVSFLKAPGYQDGHAGYSSPLDEQNFVVPVVNAIMNSPNWQSTAIVIMYDDSDGWYDHQLPPIVNQSTTTADALTGPGACGNGASALPGVNPNTAHAQGRCGFGPRLPMILISPWAQQNYVDHTLTNLASPMRFIEDNWLGGQRVGGGSFDAVSGSLTGMFNFSTSNPPNTQRKLLLNPSTGLQQ